MKKRTYRWYVQPHSPHTNTVLAQHAHDSFEEDLPDDRGVLHQVWECPFNVIEMIMRGGRAEGYLFSLFVREGRGKLRSAAFLMRKRRLARPAKAA